MNYNNFVFLLMCCAVGCCNLHPLVDAVGNMAAKGHFLLINKTNNKRTE